MSRSVDHLLGRPFRLGSTDCYGLARSYFSDVHDIPLRDYARPTDFWDHGLDLYSDHFRAEGFSPFTGHPRDYRQGDVFLMAIRAAVPNHCAINLGDDRILHHLVGGPSRIESYNRPLFRDTTVAVLRHPSAKFTTPIDTVNLLDLLPNDVRQKFAPALPDA